MYEKIGSLLLRSSVSALSHNLDVSVTSGERALAAVIHKSTVNVLAWNPRSDKDQKAYQVQAKDASGAKTNILQVKWCVVNKVVYLVVISQEGLQIYDETGSHMQFWYHFEKDGWYGSCLAFLADNRIALGTNTGNVVIFNMGPQGRDAFPSDTIDTGHKGSVSVLTASSHHLASGGNDGNVYVWQTSSPYGKLQSFDSYGFSCTGISLWNDWILTAYGSGHMRLFDVISGQILSEVTAHAKWISAMDVAESSGYVLTVSEDSFLRVWQLNKAQEAVISLKYSECILDIHLTGGRFLDSTGKKLAVTGFESEEIMCYSF